MADQSPSSDDEFLDQVGEDFKKLVTTIARLRHPRYGCPWDLEQTHASLRRYMLEEAYEACEAMGRSDHQALTGELGDVLLQVVLNARLGQDAGQFHIGDVIRTLDEKMIRRHPHVFNPDAGGGDPETAGEVRQRWEEIKATEKAAAPVGKAGLFAGVSRPGFPAADVAVRIGKRAAAINFDWGNAGQVLQQLRSEIEELAGELQAPVNREALADELGDVYFTLAQLCRHLSMDPEVVALQGNHKFLDRFRQVEDLAAQKSIDPAHASQEQLETLWKEAKGTGDQEKKKNGKPGAG